MLTSLKNDNRQFEHLLKFCPRIKTPKKDELIILGSTLSPKSQVDSLEIKTIELEKGCGIVEKIDVHYGFLC